jgi:pimeloyl-ACP methyl ester carboxylesterase
MDELLSLFVWSVLGLAALALVVYLVSKLVEWRNPPIGKFLEVEGTKLHYFEDGSGLPTVFLHGNTTMLQDFTLSAAFRAVAKHNRAIAFDRPGFGYSTRPRTRTWTASDQADVIGAALRKLNLGPVALVGHSWGTLVAVALAERHPALVRSLVLLSGYYYPVWRFDAAVAALGATPVIGDILRYTVSPVFGLIMLPLTLRILFAPCPVSDQFQRNFPRLMMLRPWQLRASWDDGAQMRQSAAALQPGYLHLSVPTFIAAGGTDRVVDPRHSETLHRQLPTSRLHILPGIGHMVHHSAPGDVDSDIHQAIGTFGRAERGSQKVV